MDQEPPRIPQLPNEFVPEKTRRGWFPRPSFRNAAGDFKAIFAHMDRRRWLFLLLSFAVTFALLFGFLIDSDFRKFKPGPQLIYVENWNANRSDAEIVAQQKRDQAVRKQLQEERRRQFQRLEKQLGMD